MALARVTTWVPGQVLTAAALNGEFNSILNNPISLVSPTTAAINFNLQPHTNFRAENVGTTPVSTAAGRLTFDTATLQTHVDDGTVTRTLPSLISSSLATGDLIVAASSGQSVWRTLGIGTAGQALIVTSSGLPPAWSSGFLTSQGLVKTSEGGTGIASNTVGAGSIFYFDPAGIVTVLGVGTTGQVLTVLATGSTGGNVPRWVAPGAAAAGTVKAAQAVFSTGNLTITSTVFVTILPVTLSLTPTTTAPRLQIHAMGTVLTSSPAVTTTGTISYTLILDGTNIGGGNDGFQQESVGLVPTVDQLHPFNLNFVTSVVSTAAHTIDVRTHLSSGGMTALFLRGDPVLAVSVYEIVTTG